MSEFSRARYSGRAVMERSTLGNGVRIVSERMPDAPSVTLGIWVENGSRYESREQAGISHFLEHLLFKGTPTRSAAQIAEEIDSVGGVLNAFTGKECTCYYVRVLAEDFDLAAGLLADIFLRSSFVPDEIDRERGVILQEISQGEDTPDDFIHDVFALNYWRGHPLSYPICGSAGTVSRFERQDFVSFMEERYRPDRLVIAAAGNITHDDLKRWVEDEFAGLSGQTAAGGVNGASNGRGVFAVDKALEQVHVCLGTPGIAQTSDLRFAAYVMNTALGGGMSSRLFQEVREKRGRAYSVYSFLSCYRDSGYLGVYAGTSPEWAEEVLDLVADEIDSIACEGLRTDELDRAQKQLKGGMLLGLETSDSRMTRLAKNEIYFNEHYSIEEVARFIDETTNDQIVEFASRLTDREASAVAVLGRVDGLDLGARYASEGSKVEIP